MRGAALKLGQMLSIQDTAQDLPPQLQSLLRQLQNQAHSMPTKQLHRTLARELGSDWRSKFDRFDDKPFAAASIGQVHYARVNGDEVAVKVQYPGVADSVVSDLNNLKALLTLGDLLPKGL